MPEYFKAKDSKDFIDASALFREYAQWLNIDLSFQNFENELRIIREMYNDEDGGIILARDKDVCIACVAVRRIKGTTAELKRMYVKPAYQNKGVGQRLLSEAIRLAEGVGYKLIRLDTLNHMIPAMELYKKNGFIETKPYYHNPNPAAVYFEKRLD